MTHLPRDHPTYSRPCPDCGAKPGDRCTSLSATRPRPRPVYTANPHPMRSYRP